MTTSGCLVLGEHGTIIAKQMPFPDVPVEEIVRLVVCASRWGNSNDVIRFTQENHEILALETHKLFVVIVSGQDVVEATLQMMSIASHVAHSNFEIAPILQVGGSRVVDCLSRIREMDCVDGEPTLVFRGWNHSDISTEIVRRCTLLLLEKFKYSSRSACSRTALVESNDRQLLICALPRFGCCAIVPLLASTSDRRRSIPGCRRATRRKAAAVRGVEEIWRTVSYY